MTAARTFDRIAREVLAEVREMGPAEVREVIRGTGFSDAQVRRALRQLKEAGIVESDKYMRKAAVWMTTDNSLTELDEDNYVTWVTDGPGGMSTLDLRGAQHAAERAGEHADAEKLSRQITDREIKGRE